MLAAVGGSRTTRALANKWAVGAVGSASGLHSEGQRFESFTAHHFRRNLTIAKMKEKPWSVYIIKCRDGRLYTGISNDVERRVKAHDTGKGCRFTKYRYPVTLVYQEECGTQSAARKRELEIQGFTRKKKLGLIDNIR